MEIRKATIEDLPALLAIGRQHYGETAYAQYAPLDDDSCLRLLEMSMRHGVFLVAEVSGRIAGMLGVVIAPFMFNNAVTTASETVFFVDKDSARQGVGRALLDACIDECKAAGVRVFQAHRLPTSAPALAALYESRGFVTSEISASKVL